MKIRSVVLAALACAAAPAALAQDAGDWIWRAGVHTVQPKSDNHPLVEVDDGTMLTFTGTYLFTPNLGLEVLASLPFTHDIEASALGGKVGEVSHLPPTVSLQYHFNPGGKVRPYIGAGLNATIFFSEEGAGPVEDLKLDPSFGPAAQFGLDIDLTSVWFINLEARWFDIDTDAEATVTGLGEVDLGTVEVDPYAFGVSIGRRF